ncbi:hypothetical protein CSOJ01_03604 [Colletotrichum sojae]|uniref:Uncharacterized protein n=1 Tax=Colletotrichum sojae TaxID=2175907 RepID=A0A8H6N0T7_9PEZI|nr:hypothetical protein CSOJ01_03604 [Colletotrichum sojae]
MRRGVLGVFPLSLAHGKHRCDPDPGGRSTRSATGIGNPIALRCAGSMAGTQGRAIASHQARAALSRCG